MRLDRWWPMKPLTPRIRTRFIKAGLFSFAFLDFEEAQDFTIAAAREPFAAFLVGAFFQGFPSRFDARLVNLHAVGEGAGKGRRDRAHQVVDFLRALRPVDTPVLGAPPAVVAAGGKILGFEAWLSRQDSGQ